MSADKDHIARMRAESDQAIEALREAGKQVHAYYSSMVEAGFSEEQALALTISMQEANVARPTEEA